MKKQYECLLIIKGTLSEEEKQKAIKQIEKIFAKFKIKTLEKIDWGRRNLAYPIKKILQGFYYFFYIEVETDAIAEMRILFGLYFKKYFFCYIRLGMFFLVTTTLKNFFISSD